MNQTKNNESSKLIILSPNDLGLDVRKDMNSVGYSTWIRALLQNWRQGTVGCKTRSEVSYSNKKPWKQKGTGRARAGSARSPLWIGGGVVFGPQPRVRQLKINKNLKKLVLNNILWDYLDNKKVFCLNWESEKPRTVEAFNLLKSLDLHKKKLVLFVDKNDLSNQLSFSNLPNVKSILFDQANAYDLTQGEVLVFLKKDNETFKNMVSQWI